MQFFKNGHNKDEEGASNIFIINGRVSLNKKRKLYGPFLYMAFSCLKATLHSHYETAYFLPFSSQEFRELNWSTSEVWKTELSLYYSHQVVLNSELLDWESNALTTRPLLHKNGEGGGVSKLKSNFASNG